MLKLEDSNNLGPAKVYSKYLNAEDMILLIKDKFINWKELVSET